MSESGWVPFWTRSTRRAGQLQLFQKLFRKVFMLQKGPCVHSQVQIWRKLLWSIRSYPEANYQIKPDTCRYADVVHYIIMHDVQFRLSNMNNVAFGLD